MRLKCWTTWVFLCATGVCLAGVGGSGTAYAAGKDEPPQPLCATGFEQPDEPGLYKTIAQHDLLEVVAGEGVGGGHALKARYVGYERGSKRIVTSFELPRRITDATLVYDVKFDQDFQFVRGGKLHGLGPDKPITGGRDMTPDGWSARAMFDDAGLRTYVYSQNKDGRYGEGPDRRLKFAFEKGRYYTVSIYVKLNDPPGRANGSMRLYVNGKGVADHRGIRFRSVDGEETKISRLLFSTFHGGSSPKWAPRDAQGNYTTVHAYFDNFAVYEGLHVREKPGGSPIPGRLVNFSPCDPLS